MIFSISLDITAKYSSFDSYSYDLMFGNSVAEYFTSRLDSLTHNYIRKLPSGSRVLDVGCGGGQIAIALAKRFSNLEFVGVDLAEEQIKRANRRLGSLDNLSFEVADALDLPFDDRRFDALISMGCIKHWSDRGLGLVECCRVLKPGGFLWVGDLDRDYSDKAALEYTSAWIVPRFIKNHIANFLRESVFGKSVNAQELENLSKQLPLKSIEILTLNDTFAITLSGLKIVNEEMS